MKPPLLALTFLVQPIAMMAQVEAPHIGCFAVDERTFDILGVAGSFVVERATHCAAVENPWRVSRDEDGSPWLERVNSVSGAIEHRRKLEPGSYGVWPDGTPAAFDALGLPGAVSEWRMVSAQWMLLRIGGYWVLLGGDQKWFYLPAAVEVSE